MIAITNIKLKWPGRLTLLTGAAFLATHFTADAQQFSTIMRTNKDTTKATFSGDDVVGFTDSARISDEYGKGPVQKKRIFLWNRNIPQSANVASVASVYAKDINTTPVRDITNILSGRLPGLYTVQTSGKAGADAASISLRGQQPLIVIDGVVRNFTNFNPNDIKSITVLSDALAAAMYGLRSSNGVLSVTTKDMGERPFELDFSAQYGSLEPLKTPRFLKGYDYMRLYNEAKLNSTPGSTPVYPDALLNAYKNGTNDPYTQPDIDWYNTVLKNSTNQQRYSLSAGGYGRTYHYAASLEHFSQAGIFTTSPANTYNTNNDYKRYSVRVNAAVDFNKNIGLTLNLFGSTVNGVEPGGSTDGILANIYQTSPIAYATYNPNGTYAGSSQFKNNILASTINSGYYLNNERTVSADLKLTYKFDDLVKGLWLSAAASMNNYFAERINRSKSFAVYNYTPDPTGGSNPSYVQLGNNGSVGAGSYGLSQQTSQVYYNILAGYDKTWNGNTIHLLGTYNGDNSTASLTQLNQVYQTTGLTTAYDWQKKYFVETGLSFSSLNFYPPGHRWAFLPSLGMGWVISNESFFKSKWINYLKLRGTVGQTAWGNPGYFPYLQNYIINGNGYNVGTTASNVSGAYQDVLANPNITWEKALKWNAGVEMAFLENKLNLVVEYYNNHYYDQLITPANSSAIFGQPYPRLNLGKKNYHGLELTAGYENNQGAAKYFIKGNLSFAYSKVINADEPAYPYPWMYSKGLPSGQTSGYEAIGFYQQGDNVNTIPHIAGYIPVPGDIKYKDLNNDGVIDLLDQKPIGTTAPLIFFGINTGISWKGFSITVLLQGVQNRNMYVSPSSLLVTEFYNGYGNVQDYHLNRWTPQTAATATYPRLTAGGNPNNTAASSFWMRDGSYLRIKNMELGYTLPKKMLAKLRLQQVRLFVNAYNLVTWSHVDELNLDPESGANSYFANQRTVNTGISIKL